MIPYWIHHWFTIEDIYHHWFSFEDIYHHWFTIEDIYHHWFTIEVDIIPTSRQNVTPLVKRRPGSNVARGTSLEALPRNGRSGFSTPRCLTQRTTW